MELVGRRYDTYEAVSIKIKEDKIASIEMIEAVGEKYLDKYFKTIKDSLKHNVDTLYIFDKRKSCNN